MMDQITTLENNGWITDYDGAWGSIILLTPDPRQDNISNIDDFVWCLCVSYRALNTVTKAFLFSSHGVLNLLKTLGTQTGICSLLLSVLDKDIIIFFYFSKIVRMLPSLYRTVRRKNVS